jgi:hypothetical protein
MIDNTKEYILCAAIKRKESRDCKPYHPNTNDICSIELGYRHHDIFHRFDREMSECEQGFYTSKGRYVDRYEAMEIAYKCGQVSAEVALNKQENYNKLFSEDLY